MTTNSHEQPAAAPPGPSSPATLNDLIALIPHVTANRNSARARATHTAYTTDWKRFETWCANVGATALPADPLTVEVYLAAANHDRQHATGRPYSPATLKRWVASINHAHSQANHAPPGATAQVLDALRGIASSHAHAGHTPRQVQPLGTHELRRMITAIHTDTTWPHTVRAVRDQAILLLGFAGAFRRSELSHLTMADVTSQPGGLHVRLRVSKTDQTGHGQIKGIPASSDRSLCVPCAVRTWIRLLQITDDPNQDTADLVEHLMTPADETHICQGRIRHPNPHAPLFRSINRHGHIGTTALTGSGITTVIKHWCTTIGLDADDYAGHSLRVGFVTEAARNGATELEIRRQTGHRSPAVVATYLREHNPLDTNAATHLDLSQ